MNRFKVSAQPPALKAAGLIEKETLKIVESSLGEGRRARFRPAGPIARREDQALISPRRIME